jgi:hypothetical protein
MQNNMFYIGLTEQFLNEAFNGKITRNKRLASKFCKSSRTILKVLQPHTMTDVRKLIQDMKVHGHKLPSKFYCILKVYLCDHSKELSDDKKREHSLLSWNQLMGYETIDYSKLDQQTPRNMT